MGPSTVRIPLASYLCNCVAEVQRPVLGINHYVQNLNKYSDRQVLGLPEKNEKTNTPQYVRHVWKNTSFFFYFQFFLRILCFSVVQFIEVGYSEVKFVGRRSKWSSAYMKFKTYQYQKTYLRAIFWRRSI